jgi:hypothetical protein
MNGIAVFKSSHHFIFAYGIGTVLVKNIVQIQLEI